MFNVNAKGAFFTLQQAARKVNSGGSIVYIGSGATLRPVPGFGLYASSLAACSGDVAPDCEDVCRDVGVPLWGPVAHPLLYGNGKFVVPGV
ncbi:SDR family NAD(P)-dependent oxidoreductase [Microbispora sp. CA-102843]|uniref:SDR family NAD(P)-dependent oxidoreductase n=1 Tax=Microbispora sp. CA-102843 TaxID=3239952 RepID=UPI003D8BA5AC